jgi:hypothetical protein
LGGTGRGLTWRERRGCRLRRRRRRRLHRGRGRGRCGSGGGWGWGWGRGAGTLIANRSNRTSRTLWAFQPHTCHQAASPSTPSARGGNWVKLGGGFTWRALRAGRAGRAYASFHLQGSLRIARRRISHSRRNTPHPLPSPARQCLPLFNASFPINHPPSFPLDFPPSTLRRRLCMRSRMTHADSNVYNVRQYLVLGD